MHTGPLLLAALSCLMAGCGANVVFGDSGSGNGGGGGGVGGSGNASGAGGSGNASGTGGATTEPTACEVLCGTGCFDSDCMQICLDRYLPGCEDRAESLNQCLSKQFEPGTCGYTPHLCDEVALDFFLCAQPSLCATDSCAVFGGGGACDCSGTCKIVDPFDFEQSCSFGPSDVECDCFESGNYIGSCSQSSLTCELETGCCFSLYFTQ